MKKFILFIIILLWIILLTGCSNEYKQFEYLEKNSLFFLDNPDNSVVIYSVNWMSQNQLTIQGFWREYQWPIFIGTLSTGEFHQLVYDGKIINGASPSITPDGRFIVFYNYDLGKIQIIDKSSQTVDVISDASLNLAWSPDGTNLAYIVNKTDTIKIMIYNTISHTSQMVFEYREENSGQGEGIAWSPDGNRIAFTISYEVKNEESMERQTDVFVFTITPNGLFRVTNTLEINEHYPSWYSNEIITFTSTDYKGADEFDGSLIFFDLYQSCSKEIKGVRGIKSPSWSPDRKQLAFVAEKGVYVIRTESVLNNVSDLSKWICEP